MRGVIVHTTHGIETWGLRQIAWAHRLRRLDAALLVLVAFFAVTSALVVHVWSRLYVLQLEYSLFEEQARQRALIDEGQRLTAEIARLRAPARVETFARQHLGLVPPAPAQVIVVGDD